MNNKAKLGVRIVAVIIALVTVAGIVLPVIIR